MCRLFDQDSGADAVAIAAIQRGELVRAKPMHALTQDESDWIYVDSILRPDLYSHRGVPDRVSGALS